MIVVADATPLIALAKIEKLPLCSLLDELRTKDFHLSDKIYQSVLRQAGEL